MAADRTWLAPVRDALDGLTEPISVFVRDDDAGWDDDALIRLLDLFVSCETPIDLAVIPAALGDRLGAALVTRADDGLLGLHQHGWSHTNHETTGRKCEFGPARSSCAQLADIVAGQERLQAILGPAVEPMFTPPWNRCTEVTAGCLIELGFTVLSRDASAVAHDHPDLAETPVSFDWSSRRYPTPDARGNALAEVIARPGDVRAAGSMGLMLHHAVMTPDDLSDVGQLLDVLGGHPLVTFVPLRRVTTGS